METVKAEREEIETERCASTTRENIRIKDTCVLLANWLKKHNQIVVISITTREREQNQKEGEGEAVDGTVLAAVHMLRGEGNTSRKERLTIGSNEHDSQSYRSSKPPENTYHLHAEAHEHHHHQQHHHLHNHPPQPPLPRSSRRSSNRSPVAVSPQLRLVEESLMDFIVI